MGSSLSSIYIHVVWSTKRRMPQISPKIKKEVEQLLISTAQELGISSISTYAMPNHVHMLLHVPTAILISDVIGKIKGRTSKLINGKYGKTLQWQSGYGAFSISASHVARVQQYIQSQPDHHKTIPFKDEFLKWLNGYNVDYEMKYVFDD